RQDLAGIAGAHRADDIGKGDATSHEVHDVGQLGDVWIEEPLRGDARDFQDAVAKDALIGQVVDGEDRCRPGELRVVAVERLRPVGDDARVPVVAVHYVRRPADSTGIFQGRAAEEDKALALIRIAVNLFALKVARRVHEEKANTTTGWRFQYVHRLGLLVNGHRDLRCRNAQVPAVGLDRLVAWEDDAHIMAQAGQSMRQRADNVGQAAGLHIGHALGGDKEHAQGSAVARRLDIQWGTRGLSRGIWRRNLTSAQRE